LARLGALRLVADLEHLGDRDRNLLHDLHDGACVVGDVVGHLLPRRRLVGAALLDQLAAGVGEVQQLAAVDLLGAHEPLVLQQLEGGVDRACARAPRATAALFELLHDLEAVARLLGEQQQRGRAHVAAARLAPATVSAGAAHPHHRAPAPAEAAAGTAAAVAAMPVAARHAAPPGVRRRVTEGTRSRACELWSSPVHVQLLTFEYLDAVKIYRDTW